MIINSTILTEWVKSGGDKSGLHFEEHGCSEFIAHHAGIIKHVSLAFNMLRNECWSDISTYMIKLGYKDSRVNVMQEWVKFCYEALKCMNLKKDEPFIELYTWKEFKEECNSIKDSVKNSQSSFSWNNEKNILRITAGSDVEFTLTDDTIIGIKCNTAQLRKHFKFNYCDDKQVLPGEGTNGSKCRKTQLAHTLLRYGWSSVYYMVPITLKLMQLNPALDQFYIMQIAWNIRGKLGLGWSADYGTLFQQNNEIMPKSMFMSKFKDVKIDGVQVHFLVSEDPLIKMIRDVDVKDSKINVDFNIHDSEKLTLPQLLDLNDTKYTDEIAKYLEKLESNNSIDHMKVRFKFVQTIFKSTIVNVPYVGYHKKGVNIDRILFKDEENTILSIAEKSKLIEIL